MFWILKVGCLCSHRPPNYIHKVKLNIGICASTLHLIIHTYFTFLLCVCTLLPVSNYLGGDMFGSRCLLSLTQKCLKMLNFQGPLIKIWLNYPCVCTLLSMSNYFGCWHVWITPSDAKEFDLKMLNFQGPLIKIWLNYPLARPPGY